MKSAFRAKQMELEVIMPSKITKEEKEIYEIFSIIFGIQISKANKLVRNNKTNT